MPYLPHALTVWREQNGLRKAEAGARFGKTEEWVSRVEDRSYILSDPELDEMLTATGIRRIDWLMRYQPTNRTRVIPAKP